jgi:hypothetical protein
VTVYEYPFSSTLLVSFQRYPQPDDGLLRRLPPSWGALPLLASGPRHVLVPLPDGEAFWLGLVRTAHGPAWTLHVLASLPSNERLDVVTGVPADPSRGEAFGSVSVPPSHAVEGIARGDGTWWPFTRGPTADAPVCRALDLLGSPAPTPPVTGSSGEPRRQHDSGRLGTSGPRRPSAGAGPVAVTSVLRVDVVDPKDFSASGGDDVPPLDAEAPYRGRRLP